jgi:hypothetical protein
MLPVGRCSASRIAPNSCRAAPGVEVKLAPVVHRANDGEKFLREWRPSFHAHGYVSHYVTAYSAPSGAEQVGSTYFLIAPAGVEKALATRTAGMVLDEPVRYSPSRKCHLCSTPRSKTNGRVAATELVVRPSTNRRPITCVHHRL